MTIEHDRVGRAAPDEPDEQVENAIRDPDADSFSRKLDWNLLKAFHEIAESGSISQAALVLSRKQPTLSLALKRLEEHLGASLCSRGTRGVALSDEGRLLAEQCSRVNRLVREIPSRMAKVGQEVRGQLKLQLISNIVCPLLDRTLVTFHRRHPHVEILIDIAAWEAVGRALLRNERDIGIAPARFHHAELSYRLLFVEAHRAYCGRAHPLFGQTINDPAVLANYGFVLTGADEPDQLTRFRLRYGLGRNAVGLSEHLEEARRLVLLGLGICFLPDSYAEPDVVEGRLWPLTGAADAPSMEIFVITHPSAPRHLARQLFLKELSRQARKEQSR
jgi:DNA-binding transcriptional LysR family regulator